MGTYGDAMSMGSSMTSSSLTTFGCLHFFITAISFLILCSVLDKLSVTAICAPGALAGNRVFFLNSFTRSCRGFFLLTTFIACAPHKPHKPSHIIYQALKRRDAP